MATIERIKDSLPHPTINPIVGQPSYEKIKPLHQEINANLASVVTNLSLLYLTVTLAVFTTLCGVVIMPPASPGPSPEIPADAAQFQI